jgi:hypothetical protein
MTFQLRGRVLPQVSHLQRRRPCSAEEANLGPPRPRRIRFNSIKNMKFYKSCILVRRCYNANFVVCLGRLIKLSSSKARDPTFSGEKLILRTRGIIRKLGKTSIELFTVTTRLL